MANREVNLTKRVQTPHGWRYCRVLLSANGRVKPDVVVVNGKEERTWKARITWSGAKAQNESACQWGRIQPMLAHVGCGKRLSSTLVNNGVAVVPDGQNGHRSLAAAVAEFLDETKLTKKPKTLAAYTTALNYFTESCHKQNLHEVDRETCSSFPPF